MTDPITLHVMGHTTELTHKHDGYYEGGPLSAVIGETGNCFVRFRMGGVQIESAWCASLREAGEDLEVRLRELGRWLR